MAKVTWNKLWPDEVHAISLKHTGKIDTEILKVTNRISRYRDIKKKDSFDWLHKDNRRRAILSDDEIIATVVKKESDDLEENTGNNVEKNVEPYSRENIEPRDKCVKSINASERRNIMHDEITATGVRDALSHAIIFFEAQPELSVAELAVLRKAKHVATCIKLSAS